MKLRPKSFWTPRYVADRLALALDQKRHPDDPWWPREAIRHLHDLLRPTDTCFEWGSGRSTVWLSARAARVLSIEHDPVWFSQVQADLRRQGLNAEAVRLVSTEPVDSSGNSPYVHAADELAPGEVDVFIVDGEHRGKCALAALEKLAHGGLLVVDDAHWFLDHPTLAPMSRSGRGPADEDWARFAAATSDWRRVWTTDGVTDTAIWIKP